MESKKTHSSKKARAPVLVTPLFRVPRAEMVLNHTRTAGTRTQACSGHIDSCGCCVGRQWSKDAKERTCWECNNRFPTDQMLRIPSTHGLLGCFCSVACLRIAFSGWNMALKESSGEEKTPPPELLDWERWFHPLGGFIEVDPSRFSIGAFLQSEEKRGSTYVEFCSRPKESRPVDDDDDVDPPGQSWVATLVLCGGWVSRPREMLKMVGYGDDGSHEYSEDLEEHTIVAFRVHASYRANGTMKCGWDACTKYSQQYSQPAEAEKECHHCRRLGWWCDEHSSSCAHCGKGLWCKFCVPTLGSMLCDDCRPQVRSVLSASDLSRDLLRMLEDTLFQNPLAMPPPYELCYE